MLTYLHGLRSTIHDDLLIRLCWDLFWQFTPRRLKCAFCPALVCHKDWMWWISCRCFTTQGHFFYDSLCGWLTVTGTERWSFREKSCSLAQSELQLIVAHQSLEVHPSRWKLLWGGLRGILHSFIVVAANHSKWPLTYPGSLTPCVLTNAISSCCVRRWIRSKADFCSPLLDRAPV